MYYSGHFKYYIFFVDHYTRYMWFYPLKRKSYSLVVLNRFQTLVLTYFGTKIRKLYIDNGSGYIEFILTLENSSIPLLTTPPHTLEHNGIVECRHHHIVETDLSLLSHSSLPLSFWSIVFATSVYLINRLPTPILKKIYLFSFI